MKWVKCNEKLPEVDKSVIAAVRYNGKLVVAPARRASKAFWIINSWMVEAGKVVAWVPFPDPPSEEEIS